MYIEYLKRKIRREYKGFIGLRTDIKANIADVANNFGIELDELRLNNYIISKIDFEKPSIELIDTKTNTIYNAEFTCNADLLNYSGALEFINIIIKNSEFEINSLKYIDNKEEIISNIKFYNGDYNLIFEKEIANNIGFGMNGKKKSVISYTKNIIKDINNVKEQILLSKIYLDKGNNNKLEQLHTYSSQRFIEYDDRQDKYSYVVDNNIIYGVNNCKIADKLHCYTGVCFESKDMNIKAYLPIHINNSDFAKEMTKQNSQSAIMFKGGTDHGTHHTIKVDKAENNIIIDYEATRWRHFKNPDGSPNANRDIIENKVISIPAIEEGKITSLEIQSVIDEIKEIDNIFIKMVIDDLKTFSKYIDIKNQEKEEVKDDLNPKIFIDKSFQEIYDLVKDNKDYYFDLISNQFYDATHILETKEKEKILKKQQ